LPGGKQDEKPRMSRIRKLAEWLNRNYPSAAASPLESVEECFTINRLSLLPLLICRPATTNIFESSHAEERIQTDRFAHRPEFAVYGCLADPKQPGRFERLAIRPLIRCQDDRSLHFSHRRKGSRL
jgi:hypothetical protein